MKLNKWAENSGQHRTYQCRIAVGDAENAVLESYAVLYGKVSRTLFSRLRSGESILDLKREFQPKFGITARQFNSAAFEISGKISSIKERRAGLIKELERRIDKAKTVLKSINEPFKLHQKKRRLAILESRLSRFKEDHASNIVRLCFGSRKLFRAQYSLKENGYGALPGKKTGRRPETASSLLSAQRTRPAVARVAWLLPCQMAVLPSD